MIKAFGRFSTRFPWLVILIVVSITAFMIYQIKTKIYVEADLTKFLPRSMPTTKANDYYKKNFNYQDGMLIGVENTAGTIMQPDVLRAIENIIIDIKTMDGTKSFKSQLTGKTETITLPLGIDTDDISSIANLEDAILDKATGAVVAGSVIAKLKKDHRIPFTEETEELLPEQDADLLKIIPELQRRVLEDRIFNGSVLSSDLKSASIRVPMQRKWDYKKRYAVHELKTAIDPVLLKHRYQGKDSLFPFKVYGKKYGLHTYDDAFIISHTSAVASKLKDFLENYLEGTFPEHPVLAKMFDNDFTLDTFTQIIQYTEARDFYLSPEMYTWENFTTGIWEFALDEIDPLSRENLEFKLFNVKDIYDLNLVYQNTLKIVEPYQQQNPSIKYYIAGTPVVTAVFTHMIGKDMGLLMPFAIGVIFLTLLISFRSARGVFIPLITVILSMIWALGSMAITKTPVTAMTSMLPVVLLAVGSAYGIHLLNRYYEDIKQPKDRRSVLRVSVEHVGIAILMAGLTTIAGFGSLVSAELELIKHFGIFSAAGVGFALLLTLTLSPAILTYWRLPRKNNKSKKQSANQVTPIEKVLAGAAKKVLKHPKKVILIFCAVFVAAAIAIPQLEYEGSQMSNFKEDNPLKISDQFLNKNLSGTNQVNILFTFRDEVNLSGQAAQKELKGKIQTFKDSWTQYQESFPEVSQSGLENLVDQLAVKSTGSAKEIKQQLTLLQDIVNEDFEVELEMSESESELDEASELSDDLEALSDDEIESSDDMGGLDDMADMDADDETEADSDLSAEQIEGIKSINQRLGFSEDQWQEIIPAVLAARENKGSASGIALQRNFNQLQDFFAVDVKQPHVLHRIEKLYQWATHLTSPDVFINGEKLSPTGLASSPVDLIRKFYKVFYHNDNPEYDRLPNVDTDPIADPTMTDRSVIGVVLNQALNSSRDTFEGMISTDLKEFQVSIMGREGTSGFLKVYEKMILEELKILFPEDDPYIKSVKAAGYALTINEVTGVIASSQTKSIMLAFLFVFIVTFFIFRSVSGGIYSLIPLLFTVVVNFGMIYALGWKITTGTMMVASIAIGIGVDYTIHFLERFKLQLKKGDTPTEAYFNTITTSGKAVVINALSVSFGFLVLVFSDFVANISMGLLMAGTMVYSSLGALILLPAIIFVLKPKFFFNGGK